MSDLDVNEGVIERDEATGLHPFKRCGACESLFLQLTDGYCHRCLELNKEKARKSGPFLRAPYRYQVKLPAQHGPEPHKYLTYGAANAVAERMNSKVEPL